MRRLSIVCFLISCVIPFEVGAYGPGVHCREADRAIELIMEEDEAWAADMESPFARSFLRIGANAPDFQWATSSLNFGHQKELSYHLLKSAESMGPEHRLFALGHLAHVTGDASAEVFVTPTIFASAPIGPMDLFAGTKGAKSESEAIVEGYGDLINGDWEAVVEVIWEMRLATPEAWSERFGPVFLWYCETGNELYDNSDCNQALDELDERFVAADDILGSSDLEGAKALVALLIDQPLDALFDLYSSGLLAFLLGQDATLSEEFDFYSALFLAGPLVDPELWAIYDKEFLELGPTFTLDHYINEVTGWPEYDGVSIISGNIQSLLHFLPDHFSPQKGLHVTDLRWRNEAGNLIENVSPEMKGETVTAEIRLFSALPYTGTIVGHVLGDRPGITPDSDDLIAEGEISVDIDPNAYSLEPQTLLTIPFIVDSEGIDGYTIELFVADDPLPWFSSNSDRLWSIEELPMHLPPYQYFGTYKDFPYSLPSKNGSQTAGSLLASIRIAPEGPGIDGALVFTDSEEQTTGANGVAQFSQLDVGNVSMSAAKTNYQAASQVIAVQPGQPTWGTLFLHAIPRPSAPAFQWASDCVPLEWNAGDFADQAGDFEAQVIMEEVVIQDWTSLESNGESSANFCLVEGNWPTQSPFKIALRARYTDGTTGLEALTESIVSDDSLPEIDEVVIAMSETTCVELTEAIRPPVALTIRVKDDQSGIDSVAIRWKNDEVSGEWKDVENFDLDGNWQAAEVEAPQGDASLNELEIRAINGAGAVNEVVGGMVEAVSPCPADTAEEVEDIEEKEENEDGVNLSGPDKQGIGVDAVGPTSDGNGPRQEENDTTETSASVLSQTDDDSGCTSLSRQETLYPLLLLLLLCLAAPRRKTPIAG